MHFATAATLMFRCAGIPDRYVEGYYLSPKEMKLYTEMSDISYNVLDSNAHCWVEIYIDEIGWFPVEVIPGFYDMEKQQTKELQEDEKIEEETKQMYEDQAPEESEPEKHQEEETQHINPLILLILFILLAILIYELAGRRHVRKRYTTFESVFTDAVVYAMYKYVSRLMAFDKHKLPANPYDRLDEISECYDSREEQCAKVSERAGTAMTFTEFLRLVNRVRFGRVSLTETEHKKMAAYVKYIGSQIYNRQSRIRKFIMKFIVFYV